jgi:hypothetical protein
MTKSIIPTEFDCSTVPADDDTGADANPPFRLRTLIILFMAESLALALLGVPLNLKFVDFALMDQGANLRVQSLIDRGRIPAVDFGYQYGLIPLLAGRAWFALLGRTPQAYAAAMLVVDLLIAWGLARCAHALRAGSAGIALILCTMTAAIQGSYINLAHALEAVLICHALAEHAYGRRTRALVLLTACLFIKPVMAYVYGFLLVLLILRGDGFRGLLRAAPPAAAVGALLMMAMAAWFGLVPLIHTLIPMRGAASYKILNYGFFFGSGRAFWLPEGVTPRHYFFTHAGHYLIGSVVLVAAAAASVWRLARARPGRHDLNAEVVACCGIMHLVFLTSFYGDRMSYTYYYYIMIIGLVALSARDRRWAIAIALLAMVALIGNKDLGGHIKQNWRDSRPGADTFGLWADAPCRQEWQQVRMILGDRTGLLLTGGGGCLKMFMPQLLDQEDFMLAAGWPLPVELRRTHHQAASADVILFNNQSPARNIPGQFHEVLDGCELVWSGKLFAVYRRLRPATRTP